jgi:hypothetical protein
VRVAHLEAVTHRENVRRGASLKLSDEDVATIRRLVPPRAPLAVREELAARFGVNAEQVRHVARGIRRAA